MSYNKKQLLVVMPEIPYPARAQGISIRYLPIIQSLYNKYEIDIILITKELCDMNSIAGLKKYCRNVSNVLYTKKSDVSSMDKIFTRVKFFIPWALPRSWIMYGSKNIEESVLLIAEKTNYDLLLAVTGYVYPYTRKITTKRKIFDFIDSPTILAKRNVIGSKRNVFIRKFENLKTFNWEAKIIREFDKTLYISQHDANAIPARIADMKKRVVIPNGFTADDYTSGVIPDVKHPNIAFIGNMSYYPNVEAVEMLVNKIFQEVKKQIPNLCVYIIGRDPVEQIIQLGNIDGVYVTGEVDTIWPYVNSMDIFVFPIVRGAGLKNKILEAMYAEKPVITTSIGNEGIDGENNKQLLICESIDEYIHRIIEYLKSEEKRQVMGKTGKDYVVNNYSWERIVNNVDVILSE